MVLEVRGRGHEHVVDGDVPSIVLLFQLSGALKLHSAVPISEFNNILLKALKTRRIHTYIHTCINVRSCWHS